MASRLRILATMHSKNSLLIWKSLLDLQVLQFTCSRNKKINRLKKARL